MRWRRRRAEPMSCAEVAAALQSHLDAEIDDLAARRVAAHLEHCRRCGLEADTYRAIKETIARRAAPLDLDTAERLRAFGERLLVEQPDAGGSSA